MYCDETTNAANIPFGINIPLEIEIDPPSDVGKNPPFWPPAAISNL
jgi:hypothetical protein